MSAGATCAHCRLPIAGARGDADERLRFCCVGCSVAHHLCGRAEEGRADPLLARIVLSAFLSMGVMCFSQALYGEAFGGGRSDEPGAAALEGLARLAAFAFSTPVLVLLGWPMLDALISLRRWLSADALVLAGTFAAWAVSSWNTFANGGHVYYETATVVLVLFATGRWLDLRAREHAREALSGLLPDCVAPVARVRGELEEEVEPAMLAAGDLVRLRPGETVPVDGRIEAGRSFVDAAALSGEEEPASLAVGDRVLAGTRLVDGTLLVRAEAVGGGRLRDEIERLLQEALASRPAVLRFADRAAGLLLPLVVVLAAVTAATRWSEAGGERALLDALSVVLISCPCALGIAMPLAFWTALGRAWKGGVLVRGGEVIERLARVRRVHFDKTGTLTSGDLRLVGVRAHGGRGGAEILAIAAALEEGSEHPIGRALRRAARESAEGAAIVGSAEDFERLPGIGVRARLGARRWTLRRPAAGECRDPDGGEPEDTCVVLEVDEAGLRAGTEAEDGHEERTGLARELEVRPRADSVLPVRSRVVGELFLASDLRSGARAAVLGLRARGLELGVLTGDGPGPAARLARELGVGVEHGLLPQHKLERVRRVGEGATAFVGDGLNDAAALAAADVGIAVAGASSRSLEVADVQLLRAGLEVLPWLFDLSRRATRIARENLVWAFAYNAAGLWLAATGRMTPIFAASAMVVSSLAVLLNTARVAGGGLGPAPGPARIPEAPAPDAAFEAASA